MNYYIKNSISLQCLTSDSDIIPIYALQEKLFSSNSRTEASLGKKLKNDMLPEIEKEHKVLIC